MSIMDCSPDVRSEEHTSDQSLPSTATTGRLSLLNADVLLHILSYLSVSDILSIRQTCQALNDITRLRAVWNTALVTQILARDLPLAPSAAPQQTGPVSGNERAPNISEYTSPELEQLIRRSLSLHENWRRGHPRRRRACTIPPHPGLASTSSFSANLKFVRLRFLRRRGGDYLVAFAHRVSPPAGSICIWDLSTTHEPRFAGYWHSNDYNSGFIMNDVPECEGVFAVSALPLS